MLLITHIKQYPKFNHIIKNFNRQIKTDNNQYIKKDDYLKIKEIKTLINYFNKKEKIIDKFDDYIKYLISPNNLFFNEDLFLKNKNIIDFLNSNYESNIMHLIDNPERLIKELNQLDNITLLYDKSKKQT